MVKDIPIPPPCQKHFKKMFRFYFWISKAQTEKLTRTLKKKIRQMTKSLVTTLLEQPIMTRPTGNTMLQPLANTNQS